jgi:sugar/nucleoside kinase (ribokinase family)
VTGVEGAEIPADRGAAPGERRIVVLGDVMVDVVARLDGAVAPGSDAPARIAFQGGGSAANVAAWLAAAGIRPVLVARTSSAVARSRTREDTYAYTRGKVRS